MNIEQLYIQYRSHIFLLCCRYIRNQEDAEDVVQIIFMKAMHHLPSFQFRSQHFTWLYRIAVNECLNYIRKNRRTYVNFDETLYTIESEQHVSPLFRHMLWKKVLHSFNNTDRIIIVLITFEAMSISEVAEVMNITRQAVHKRWSRICMTVSKRIGGFL